MAQRFFGMSWVAIALAASGCCCFGGSSPSASCAAEVEYTAGNYAAGAPFVGNGGGTTEAEARTNACWSYCFEADGAFQGIFQIWLGTPEGQNVSGRMRQAGTEVSVRRVIIDESTSLEQQFGECVSRCERDATAGTNGLRFRSASCG